VRLALDATYALDAEPSGVARYCDRLVRELARLAEVELTLCARWPRFAGLRRHFAGLRFRSCWLQEPFNFRLPGSVDLFHGLNQRLPRYRFRRQVVTVHDVFPLSSERYARPSFRARFSTIVGDAVARADRIICVSAYTRDQLCRLLPVEADACVVIHHGVDQAPPEPSEAARQRARKLAGPDPFFLAVGAVQVRKNTLAAVQAVARLPGRVRLVAAGGAGHEAGAVVDFIRRHRLGDRVRLLGYVDQQTLDALYAEAAALLFPSLEEGFGLPLLEAMTRGLPVIASNVSSVPEIVGVAAILLDPQDVEGMAEAARRLLQDQAWRAEWGARGHARARCFTWEAAAHATLAVYRSLL